MLLHRNMFDCQIKTENWSITPMQHACTAVTEDIDTRSSTHISTPRHYPDIKAVVVINIKFRLVS